MSAKPKTVTLAIRVKPELKKELQKKADYNDETLSQAIRHLLILGIEHLELINEAYDNARKTIKERETR